MATIKDVAEHAGVSITTVSRILNNRGPISEKTREKVQKVMKELNYQPNEMARALQKSRSYIIGLIIPLVDYGFFSRIVDSIVESCHEQGYKLMLCKSDNHEERELEMVSMLHANKVDGILICSRLGDASFYTQYNLPIVSIDREIEKIPSVTTDNYHGGMLAARALINTGSKNLFIFGGEVPDYMAMNLRSKGFKDECQQNNVKCYEWFIKDITSDRCILDEFISFINKIPYIDGVFVTSDIIASKLLCSKKSEIVEIINRIPIVGYDGLEISELLGFSTIAQPIYEMGEFAVDLLIRKIEGKIIPERSILPVELVERNSTLKYKQN